MDDSKKLAILKAQSGHDILVIDNIEMHSKFNPVQEAYDQCLALRDKIKKQDHILILGIGLGYHIQQLEFKMREFHKNPVIYVVEPNEEVVKLAMKYHIVPQGNVKIFSGRSIDTYYQDQQFIDFLNDKPLIVPHNPSLNLEYTFFKKFLSHKSSRKLSDITKVLHPEIKPLFHRQSQHTTLNQFINDLGKKENLVQDDFKLLAFGELCNSLQLQEGQYEN